MTRIARWIAVGVVGLMLLLVITAIVAPFVIEIDQYRPRIVQAVNERINGKLAAGKFSLSLWGRIRVDIAGLELKDEKDRTLLKVAEAYLDVPFSSMLAGAPVLTLKLRTPEVNLIKDKTGRLNALSVAGNGSSETEKPSRSSSQIALPALAARARLNLELLQANLSYIDLGTDLKTRLSDLNILLRDLSLAHSTQLEIWANLDTRIGKEATVRGPVRLKGAANPQIAGGKLEKISIALHADADELEIRMPGVFQKEKGVLARADVAIGASESEIRFERLQLQFHNAEVKGSGAISGLLTEGGGPSARFELESNAIELKAWQELVPFLQSYAPSGTLQLTAKASGGVSNLSYEAALDIREVSLKAPGFKARPVVTGNVHLIADQVDRLTLRMQAPGNDLEIQGKVVSFKQPRAELTVTSSGLDLDQLLELPPLGGTVKESGDKSLGVTALNEPASSESPAPNVEPLAGVVTALQNAPMARAVTGSAKLKLRSLKVYGIDMTDISGDLVLRDLKAELQNFSMKLWKGAVTGVVVANLGQKIPAYQFSMKVSQLDLREAVASQLQLFKNTATGKADFQMTGEGAGFDPDAAKKVLKARGKVSIKEAAFASIDVAKMAGDALNRALENLSGKVPSLRGKSVQPSPNRDLRYELISSDVVIADGTFSAPNFVAKAVPGKAIDLNGATTLGLIDHTINADWWVTDTYNLTRAADISLEVGGVRIERVLAEAGKPVRFPLHIGCKLAAPCYSYERLPEHLAKIALANIGLTSAKRLAPGLDKAPPAVQKGLDEIRKKLFR